MRLRGGTLESAVRRAGTGAILPATCLPLTETHPARNDATPRGMTMRQARRAIFRMRWFSLSPI